MKATYLIYEAAGRPTIPSQYGARLGRCAVCGGIGRYDVGDVLGESFTNWASCADPSSTSACAACLFCLREPSLRYGGFAVTKDGLVVYESTAQSVSRVKSPQGKASAILRVALLPEAAAKCGVVAGGERKGCGEIPVRPRASFWELLAEPPAPPFVLALNTAGGMPLPRHMAIASRTAAGREVFPVTYCLDRFDWRPSTWVPAREAGAKALREGLWVIELRTGRYRNAVLTAQRALVRETEALLAPLRDRTPFDLLIDMLPRPARDDGSDSIRTEHQQTEET